MANNRAYTKTGDTVHEMLDNEVYPRAFIKFNRRDKESIHKHTSFNPDLTSVLATGLSGKKYAISERVVTSGKPHYVYKHTVAKNCWARGIDTYRGESESFPTLKHLVVVAMVDDNGLETVYTIEAQAYQDYALEHKAEAKNVCYGTTLKGDGSLYEEVILDLDLDAIPTSQVIWRRPTN